MRELTQTRYNARQPPENAIFGFVVDALPEDLPNPGKLLHITTLHLRNSGTECRARAKPGP